MASIEITGLSRVFKNTVAVDGVSLTVEDGDFLVLLGPSGCGKTTLLRMLAGLLEPTSGQILLDGRDITRAPAKQRDLAMVFQSYALYPHLSVASNLAFPLRARRVAKAEIKARVDSVARMLEIDQLLQRKPKELSGGQRQRVAVGRALVREPGAYLMDEPLSNLDAKLRTATRQELTELHRRLQATFVYVTHDQVEAMTMATKIAVLNAGRLEQYGSPTEVYDRPASTFVAGFLGSPAMNLFEAGIDSADGSVTVAAPGLAGRLWPGRVEPFPATVGIRPEHLIIDPPGRPDGVTLTATVDLVENLGHDELVITRVGDRRVIVRRPRPAPEHGAVPDQHLPGRTVRLWAPIDHLHLFDQTSGRRLEWVADPVSRRTAAATSSVSELPSLTRSIHAFPPFPTGARRRSGRGTGHQRLHRPCSGRRLLRRHCA